MTTIPLANNMPKPTACDFQAPPADTTTRDTADWLHHVRIKIEPTLAVLRHKPPLEPATFATAEIHAVTAATLAKLSLPAAERLEVRGPWAFVVFGNNHEARVAVRRCDRLGNSMRLFLPVALKTSGPLHANALIAPRPFPSRRDAEEWAAGLWTLDKDRGALARGTLLETQGHTTFLVKFDPVRLNRVNEQRLLDEPLMDNFYASPKDRRAANVA